MEQTLILVHCTDAVGLVSSIAHVVAKYGLNITTMREYVDESTKRFFSRIVCMGKAVDPEKLMQELLMILPKGASVKVNPPKQKRLAILVTKEPHCLGDTLVRYFFNTLGADVCCVIGNYDHLRSFTERFNVPYHFVSHEGKTKDEFEKELHKTIYSYSPDYVVLAKFMRILSPVFIAHYQGKIINIHHSFLPAFIGANPYQQAYTRGVKIIGATAHFVTDDLDEGPIIAQDVKPVNHTYTADDMRKAGKEIEKAVLSKALSLIIEDRVFVTGNKTVVFE
ncbi:MULTISPECIES: formyltetrahydrofolate deformylase [Olivibacter]|jgi:formyltetrahydrofolate deformylase|uniref:Formyltetrahydrofolate deformylase n=2 Tax=Olivibacter TaxID=376469 RepID=A0ABV6HFT1_9SPHI|nr:MULTISPECIES: formyltetrahydrofolate deformylase [Olivibacter]MCL4638386.1 formyltetrahydrofolate deformylase [Olivibacter sp. UJ_SKK_5.1]MDM8177006.1 formyltetrahydrofolate deformylase [Olivibacter sp. 47]MDX3912502.1 formyltetrahydrofolate deformylase [Pseudosphingobacterium sp.]QEL00221.1 formyltetrahydrofolate deformylase [Olivibacter sp. LS-1]